MDFVTVCLCVSPEIDQGVNSMLSSIEFSFEINTAPKQNKAKKLVRMTSFSCGKLNQDGPKG